MRTAIGAFFLILCPFFILLSRNSGLQLGVEQQFPDTGDFAITATVNRDSIVIRMPDMDVERFIIYRGTEKDGMFKKTGNVKGTSFTDDKIARAAVYYYVAVGLVKEKEKEKEKPVKGTKKTRSREQWRKLVSGKLRVETEAPITEVKVNFRTDPENAELFIDNEKIGLTPLSRNLKLGTYQLSFQKTGYRIYRDVAFSVDYRPVLDVSVKLEKIRSGLVVTTTPPGARITINNQSAGLSPLEKDGLDLGTCTVRAEMAGYKPMTGTVVLESEAVQKLNFVFEKEIFRGNAKISSVPESADVLIDNAALGKTPLLARDLTAGLHKLTLKKSGCNDLAAEIEVEADQTKEYTFTLLRESGLISIASMPDGADCYLNNTLIGQTPIREYRADAGTYGILVKKKDYDDYSEIVAVPVNSHIKRDLLLNLKKATLMVSSRPDRAHILLNGIDYGSTPFVSENIQPGKIALILKKDGYDEAQSEVTLKPGAVEELSFTLKEIPAIQAALPPPPQVVYVTNVVLQPVVVPAPVQPVPQPAPDKGTVYFSSQPSDAAVYLNGKLLGRTLLVLKQEPGQAGVRMVKQNYKPAEGSVIVKPGDSLKVHFDLMPLEAGVYISSVPPGAELFVNSKSYGTTPLKFVLQAGDYALNLNKTGYESFSTGFTIAGEAPVNKTFTLKKEVRKSSFTSEPAGAEVVLRGKIIGITPFEYSELPDGIYAFVFRKNGYRQAGIRQTVSGGMPSAFSARLEALKGDLLVNASPFDSELYIDNSRSGRTGETVRNIPAGYHTVTVKKYGYHDLSQKVLIRDQQLTKVSLTLAEKEKGNLEVISVPAGASVYLNNTLKGATPLLVQSLPEDKYGVRITAKGYKTFSASARIYGRKTETINAQLVPGSDCFCLGTPVISKPVFWYITSAACLIGSGYAWYEEEQAIKRKDWKKRSQLHEIRNGAAIAGGISLTIGIAIDLFD